MEQLWFKVLASLQHHPYLKSRMGSLFLPRFRFLFWHHVRKLAWWAEAVIRIRRLDLCLVRNVSSVCKLTAVIVVYKSRLAELL